MRTYVALLRAVNVGGYGKLSMADFRNLLDGLGFKNVRTYIQSGNAVFDVPSGADAPGSPARVRAAIAAGLAKLTWAPVDVILRTHEDLARVIAGNPFAVEAAADGARVHVAFLAGQAAPAAAAALEAIAQKYPARRDRYHLAETISTSISPRARGKPSSPASRWTGRWACPAPAATGIPSSSCTRCRKQRPPEGAHVRRPLGL